VPNPYSPPEFLDRSPANRLSKPGYPFYQSKTKPTGQKWRFWPSAVEKLYKQWGHSPLVNTKQTGSSRQAAFFNLATSRQLNIFLNLLVATKSSA